LIESPRFLSQFDSSSSRDLNSTGSLAPSRDLGYIRFSSS